MLISLIEKRRQNLDNFVVGSVQTDLSEAFDAVPHDLLIVKLSAYSSTDEALSYIY